MARPTRGAWEPNLYVQSLIGAPTVVENHGLHIGGLPVVRAGGMDGSSVSTAYATRLAELRAALASLDTRSRRISTLRGITFFVAAGFGGARLFRPVPPLVWVVAGTSLATFIVLVVIHAVIVTRMAGIEIRLRLVERGPRRMAGDFADFPDRGDRFGEPGHPNEGDLDLFGTASLYQLVTVAETGAGEGALAGFLSAPATAAEIAARQVAVKELAAMPRFREDLAVRGVESGTKGRAVDPFLQWAESTDPGPSPLLMAAGQGLVGVTVLLLAGSQVAALGPIHGLWVVSLIAQVVVYMVLRPKLAPILAPVSSPEAPLGRYRALLRLIEGPTFTAPRLAVLRASLTDSSASRAIGRLERILGYADARHSGMLMILLETFLLWDVFCAAALLRWRATSGKEVRRWIHAVGELEALSSLATFAHEHPDFTFPSVDAGALHFSAEGLGHPLIPPSRRVVNDVVIGTAGSALLITGSNMSGKSTLLRAIGVNAVLALAGAPVCARRLDLAECCVRTSMRIRDSLEEGVSHFYAELARLKDIVDAVNAGERVIFLLDEVLHGTNSRERRIGASAIVLHLLDHGALGAVSSHDLGLADLEERSHGRVRNVHFQEQVEGNRMTFDYRLLPGVVTSANALRLMKLIGIAVDLPEALTP